MRAIENGTIGEARTRSLLLDRFWLLERSVDVEGADFIIMRRHTLRSLLDPKAPRVGFVQVKFFESEATSAHVHAEYVLDRAGKPRTEFFVIAHTGREAGARMFFMDAGKVAAMPLKEDEKGKRFVLRGKDVLTESFRAPSPNVVLDVIERALERADWGHNREFLMWALPSAREEEPLPERFAAPLPIEGANLRGSFRELKKKARHSLFNIDDVREPLARIAASNDPVEAFGLAEELYHQHTGGYGDTHVGFDPGYDEDAHNQWLAYSELHGVLEEHDLVLAAAEIRRRFDEAVVRVLFGATDERDLRIGLRYAVDTLEVRDVAVAFVDEIPAPDPEDIRQDFTVLRVAPDHVEFFWRKPSTRHCWHPERNQPDEHRKLTGCREHIASYAEDGLARVLREIVCGRFPEEAFRFYR